MTIKFFFISSSVILYSSVPMCTYNSLTAPSPTALVSNRFSTAYRLLISMCYSTRKSWNHMLSLYRPTPKSFPTTNFPRLSLIANWLEIWSNIKVKSHSQIYFTTVGLPPNSSSWRQAPWDPRPDFFQLNSCGNRPYVTSSLTRSWGCLSWICLAFCQMYISHI
jgi:hypothetical protein